MIENSANQDKLFENTHIVKLCKDGDKNIALTSFGEKITYNKIIIATGFNWELLNKSELCERFISYSIVTAPIEGFGWFNNALIHDVEEPYHYLRLLPDNRIIFGGEDTTFNEKPIDENKSNKKYDQLTKDLFELFPNIKNTSIDFKFCGSFGTTSNNMGLIGESGWDENTLLFISCGANGIINAMSGIDIIKDILKGKDNALKNLFSPTRSSLK
ncbi:MAG: FAD-dependent oxidoreductase [Christensenellales bacterium]